MIVKKFVLVLLLVATSLNVSAQFEKGTKYANLSLTGLDMSYSKNAKFHFGLEAQGGYFVEQSWMPYARFGYNHQGMSGPDMNTFDLGAGVRYAFQQNGIFVGCGLLYEFEGIGGFNNNYIHLTPEVGYCFYLNHYLSIEPVVYYNLCLNKFSDGSKIGLKLGFGYYF